jgi:ATP-binding cassette subfamily C (CFTR/MRP) protein 2
MAHHQEYVMEALSAKTVLLVTHQVDFLPAFDSILVGILVKLLLFSQ